MDKDDILGNNGDKYDGEWLQWLKHGKGQDIFANGDSYTGQYRYGKPWGIGVYQWKNGSVYQGQFKNGLKHGKGKWHKGTGEDKWTFEGNYIKGKKEGYGEFRWASGNFYRGEYKNDERHGYGEMFWVDGSWYKGSWVSGIQHGQGVMQLPDGTVKRGVFENNVFIEEIAEEDENLETSIVEHDSNIHKIRKEGLNLNKKKRKTKKKKELKLPNINTNFTNDDDDGQYFSHKKPLIRNISEPTLRSTKRTLNLNSRKHISESSSGLKRHKNTFSLPKIPNSNKNENTIAMSERLKGFTGIAKNQAVERKKLEKNISNH